MKSILVFSSLLFISIAAFFQGVDVSAKATMPNYSKPGESFEMVVTIAKAQLSGFSKFQMILPDGITAENIDSKGGTYSFVDQKLKIIWVSLPAESEFSIKFKINTQASLDGTFDVGGKFSYIKDGARSDTGFNNKIVISNSKPENLEEITASPDPVVNVATSAPNSTSSTTASPVGTFTFFRSLSENSIEAGDDLTVTLEIGKGNISGFGKITELIPAGYTAEVIEANGAVFSAVAGEVRFMWMTLPAENKFKVSYSLTSTEKIGGQIIKGSFSYVEDDKTRINSTSASSFNVAAKQELIASETPKEENPSVGEESPEENSTSSPTEGTSDQNTATTSSTESSTSSADEESVSTASSTETNSTTTASSDKIENTSATESSESVQSATATSNESVSYRVQICATKKNVDTQYFVKNHSVNEKIYADMHEGWHKYTVGQFSVYKQARDHREDVRTSNKIVGPFVTAYNSGQRITVQEALMISKQQWIP